MSDESVPKSARLTPDEQTFLDEMKIDFSTFTHEAIADKQKKVVKLSKKQKMNNVIKNGFFVILGLLFFMALGPQSNLVVIAIVGGLGALFSLIGDIGLYLDMKADNVFKEGLFVRKK
jgi:protein-S-isoprenylcysteine O-methyltransferase Ste14